VVQERYRGIERHYMSTKKKDKKTSNPSSRACCNCFASEGSTESELLACARCGLVLYCSRDCQRAHWKVNHKQHCISKADRVPSCHNPPRSKNGASGATNANQKCVICLDLLAGEATCTLPCRHVFHGTCVAKLRSFGVSQACPLCRVPLPPGTEKLMEDASRRMSTVYRLVACRKATWFALPASAQRDADAAVAGWRAAAEQGNLRAMHNLACVHEFGHGVAQNSVEAVRFFKMAAGQGDADSQGVLGVLYAKGRGVARDDAEAVKWYRMAADQGHAEAQYNLGRFYHQGREVEEDQVEAARLLKLSADHGYVPAQSELGDMFRDGRGVAQNDTKAARYYKMAASLGHSNAQCNVGFLYQTGRGVAKDYMQAFSWYKKAADKGLEWEMGDAVGAHDSGAAACDVEAFKRHRNVAKQGFREAYFNLGVHHENGWGVAQNYSEAARWYRKAAGQGLALAQNNLGRLYSEGLGVKKNDAEAARWYKHAAEQGIASAQCSIGAAYEQGLGVEQSDMEAARWYVLAAGQGHALALQYLSVLGRSMEKKADATDS